MKTRFILIICLFLTISIQASEDLQGVWIASVLNINFPSQPGLSAEVQKAEISSLLDAAEAAGLNAVFVQVRPECDALYKSSYEPWSRFLTGVQGRDPGYDPLETFIIEGRKRGLAVHAWLNPYRAAISAKEKQVAGNHVSAARPQFIRKVDNLLWVDPGEAEVRDQIVRVVTDIVSRYDVAGIHFDDYFYPYPKNGKLTRFPDDSTFRAYQRAGGNMGREDWRRDNVNQLIKSVSVAVHKTKPNVVFGVSPFGIYTKGQPSDVKAGVDQYKQLFSDPLTWMREGWVDYLSPQLYWSIEGPQSFRSLLKWWRSPEVNPRGVPVCPGIAVDRMISHGWSAPEIEGQLKIEDSSSAPGRGGFILWNIKSLQLNTKGIKSVVKRF